ncbi:hypothetical protein LMG26411_02679 [Cupriavidus numazuensis]|uniref:Uncharacterized protein n=1 Tax=Cupriavidus numazuensis TaxID=221992 RepID=A0ABN7PX23_9BURK|nr:hypothetical protein LMG26411_02679 [Cupriavidus numazuensis]
MGGSPVEVFGKARATPKSAFRLAHEVSAQKQSPATEDMASSGKPPAFPPFDAIPCPCGLTSVSAIISMARRKMIDAMMDVITVASHGYRTATLETAAEMARRIQADEWNVIV